MWAYTSRILANNLDRNGSGGDHRKLGTCLILRVLLDYGRILFILLPCPPRSLHDRRKTPSSSRSDSAVVFAPRRYRPLVFVSETMHWVHTPLQTRVSRRLAGASFLNAADERC